MKDVYLIFHGRNIKLRNDELIARKATAIISDVINQTMGGTGVLEEIKKMWPVDGEVKEVQTGETRDERRKIIEYHKNALLKKRKSEIR